MHILWFCFAKTFKVQNTLCYCGYSVFVVLFRGFSDSYFNEWNWNSRIEWFNGGILGCAQFYAIENCMKSEPKECQNIIDAICTETRTSTNKVTIMLMLRFSGFVLFVHFIGVCFVFNPKGYNIFLTFIHSFQIQFWRTKIPSIRFPQFINIDDIKDIQGLLDIYWIRWKSNFGIRESFVTVCVESKWFCWRSTVAQRMCENLGQSK